MDTDREEFERLVGLYARGAEIEHGATSTVTLDPDAFRGTLRIEGVKDQYATFEWEPDLSWKLITRSEQYTYEVSGTFPAKDFGVHVLIAARNVRAFPSTPVPPATVALRVFMGAIPVAALVILVRVLAITYSEHDIHNWIASAQRVLVGFGFDDWFNLALGSALATPTAAAVLVAVTAWLLAHQATGGLTFEHDGLNWQTILVGFVGMLALAVALISAEWWLKIVIALAASVLLYVELTANPIRDLRKSRKIGSAFANRPEEGRSFVLVVGNGEPDEDYNEKDAGAFIAAESTALLDELHARRDAALNDEVFLSRWTRTSTLAHILTEFKAGERSRGRARLARMRANLEGRLSQERARNGWILIAMTIVPAAFFLVVSPTPWMPAVCLEIDDAASTAYPLGGSPDAFLIDSTRRVLIPEPPDYTVTFGACTDSDSD